MEWGFVSEDREQFSGSPNGVGWFPKAAVGILLQIN